MTTLAVLPDLPTFTAPTLPEGTAETLRQIIYGTKLSRADVETSQPEAVVHMTAKRIEDNLSMWLLTGDWPDRPRTRAETIAELLADGDIDEVEAAALMRKGTGWTA